VNDWLTPAVSFSGNNGRLRIAHLAVGSGVLLLAGPIFSNKRLKACAMIRTELSFTFDPSLAPIYL
jgi:hypothetical protein